jgi:hypothetical protein
VHSRPLPTSIYDERASALGATRLNAIYEELKRIPPTCAHPISDGTHVRHLLCLHLESIVRAAREIGDATQLAWFSGRFLAASALIRMTIELAGASAYADKKVLRKLEGGQAIIAQRRMNKLLVGSKGGDMAADLPPVNVLDLVRAADTTSPGAAADYAFLCDAAHPSYMQNTLLLLAGSTYDNWSNETFTTRMHVTLDRTLRAGEAALAGIETVGLDMLRRCLPPILEEMKER